MSDLANLRDRLKESGVSRTRKLDELISNFEHAYSGLDSESARSILGRTARELVEAHQLQAIAPFAQSKALAGAMPGTWNNVLNDDSDILEAREQPKTGRRNRQYELWLCARFLESGIDAVWTNHEDEPDVRISYATTSILIEAKRPGKLASVDHSVFEACNQLSEKLKRETDSFGMVAISLDLALLEHHLRILSCSPEQVDEHSSRIHPKLRRYCGHLVKVLVAPLSWRLPA